MSKNSSYIPIVIINWNGFDHTVECLDSVLAMSYSNFKVFLVDNGSDHDEGSRLSQLYVDNEQIEVRCLNSNLGFAKANNLILKELLGTDISFVALLNNDTVVDEQWLSNLVASAKDLKGDIMSSKSIYYYDRSILDNVGHQMLTTGEVVPIGHGRPIDHYNHTFENVGSCAAGTLFRCDMLRKIGVFDDFFSTGYEDAEIGIRAMVTGYRCVFAPDAIIYHKVGQSIRKIFDTSYATMIQESIWYSYFKLMPIGVILISLPFILIKLVLIFLLNLLFFRPKYNRVLFRALRSTAFKNRAIILEKRRTQRKLGSIGWIEVLRKQTFFLWFDIKRFVNIFVRGQQSAIDTYGGEKGKKSVS